MGVHCNENAGQDEPQASPAIRDLLEQINRDPSLLSDLEGRGPGLLLEEAFADLCQTEYALAVTSCTAALHTALLALGIGPGDEVITSPYSWEQTVAPILFVGATAVFADIDPDTLHLNTDAVAGLLTESTKAIMVPHLAGHMANMPALQLIASAAGVPIISDAAQALGAKLFSKPVGAWGDITCFSLGRGKVVTSGEGGMLVTNSEGIYQRAVALTQHPERYWQLTGQKPEGFSLNYRYSPMLAPFALQSLELLEQTLNHRRRVQEAFFEALGQHNQIARPKSLTGEEPIAYDIQFYWLGSQNRAELCEAAHSVGVPLFPGPIGEPLHLRLARCSYPKPVHHWTHQAGSCPVAEAQCGKREMWVLRASEMGDVGCGEVFKMGEGLKRY